MKIGDRVKHNGRKGIVFTVIKDNGNCGVIWYGSSYVEVCRIKDLTVC